MKEKILEDQYFIFPSGKAIRLSREGFYCKSLDIEFEIRRGKIFDKDYKDVENCHSYIVTKQQYEDYPG